MLNVLRGEMSLVGPRPLRIRDYRRLEDWHRKRDLVLPGMTGLWQISGRSSLGLRRSRAARLLLHRELVALARHLDPGEDGSGGANPPRRLLAGRLGTRRRSARAPRGAASSRGSRTAPRRGRRRGAARLAVGLGRVPHDLALEAGGVRDQLGQVADGDLVARAEVDRLGAVIALAPRAQIPSAASSTYRNSRVGLPSPQSTTSSCGLEHLPDQGRNDVRPLEVEVVARAEEVGLAAGGRR